MSQKINATDITEEEALNAVSLSVRMNSLNKQMIFVARLKAKSQTRPSFVVK